MTFEQRVVALVKAIPPGKVSSYGTIAALASTPAAARAVGMILRHSTEKYQLPWQRVINSQGRISIANFNYPAESQAELLKTEGVSVIQKAGGYYIASQEAFIDPSKLEKLAQI